MLNVGMQFPLDGGQEIFSEHSYYTSEAKKTKEQWSGYAKYSLSMDTM